MSGEDRKNECVLSSVFVFILVLLRLHLTCACVYLTGVHQSLLRAMFYCVQAFRVFIWFTQVVGLQSRQHRY